MKNRKEKVLMTGEGRTGSNRPGGFVKGQYPEIDTSEPLPKSLQRGVTRQTEFDFQTEDSKQ